MSKNLKSTAWATIIYKSDNKLNNYIEIINRFNIKSAISPLHNMDIFNETLEEDGKIIHYKGQFKEPHYHCLMLFNRPKSLNQITDLLNGISSENKIECVHDKTGYYEYLYHKNDYDKYQYDKNEIKCINSNESDYYEDYIQLADIIFKIKELNLTKISDLYYLFYDSRNKDKYYKIIKNNAYLLTQILKENNYETYNQNEK